MGCDIHFYVETKQPDGSWKAYGEFENEAEEGEGTWLRQKGVALYDSRNYNLFAILADVRNGRGFAGIKTGEGFNPISSPRGVPQDASPEYKQIVEQWDCDGHSHSFHTLRQLLDYDWTQVTQLQGWVDFPTWADWSRWKRERGFGPDSYCGGVGGGQIVHLDAKAMDALCEKYWALEHGEPRKAFLAEHANTYGQAVWQVPYYRPAETFLSETLPNLLKLAGGLKGADDVRIVFFFDN